MKHKSTLLLLVFFSFFSFFIFQKLQALPLGTFIFSDSLYLPVMDRFGWNHYSSPINTNYFPDYFLYQFSGMWSSDAFVRVIYTGLIQFGLIAFVVTLVMQPLAAIAYLSLFLWTALDFAVSLSSHTLLILQVILTMHLPGRHRVLAVTLFALSDPMFLLIASAYLVADSMVHKTANSKGHAFLLLIWLACFIHGELNNYYNRVFLMLLVGALGSLSVTPLFNALKIKFVSQFRTEKVCGFLLLLTALSLALLEYPAWPITAIRERYIIAVLGCGLFFLFRDEKITSHKFWLSMACGIIFSTFLWKSAPFLTDKIKDEFANFDCLATELSHQNIHAIGVDYWVSKPLFLRSTDNIKLIQVEFYKAQPFLWGSPYEWAYGELNYFLQRNGCTGESERTHCTKDWLDQVAKPVGLVCTHYTLYKANQHVVFDEIHGKSDAIKSSFIEKVIQKFNL